MSDGEKSLFRNQSIPLLLELLHVASQTNASIMFDIKIYDDSQHCKDHPHLTNSGKIIVDTIVDSGFPNEKVLEIYLLILICAVNGSIVCILLRSFTF